MNTQKPNLNKYFEPEEPQPDTADIDAALDRQKQYTRKLHARIHTDTQTQQHPLDIPRPGNKPPVGPLIGRTLPHPGISDGDTARVLCFMNLSGAYSGYQNAEQAANDARELARRYNVHDKLVADRYRDDELIHRYKETNQALQAHADKLAEALRDITDALYNETYHDPRTGKSDSPWIASVKTKAREALSAWEKEQ